VLEACYDVFMANTRSTTFSIRLKAETKRRLTKLAQASGRSANFLISDAVESYVADQERISAEIRQADRQIRSGHYIRHEDMKAWLLSWGTDRELRPPKCACGKVHDDEELCR
jgi:predicted transcriptional regulator